MNPKTRTGVSAVLAGALTIILIYILQAVTGKVVPPEVNSAITVSLTVLVRFFVPERDGENTSNSAGQSNGG